MRAACSAILLTTVLMVSSPWSILAGCPHGSALARTLSSRDHADIDQARVGSEACSAETDSEAQSVASSNDQSAVDFDDHLDANNDDEELGVDFNNDGSDADPDEKAYYDSDLDPCPLPVRDQLCCTITGQKASNLPSTAVGSGYHAVGATYGSILGLRRGMRRSA